MTESLELRAQDIAGLSTGLLSTSRTLTDTVLEDIIPYKQIGDDLHYGQYRLVDKLGYGGYSTIWLARDLPRARYVAVKVITADASACTPESSLIHSLADSLSTLGKEIIPPLLDEFWVAGPNGKYRCIATAPAQMSLFDAKEASILGIFQPKVARSIIAQLIRGVAFLYSEDVIHGGM